MSEHNRDMRLEREKFVVPRWLRLLGATVPVAIPACAALGWLFYVSFTAESNARILNDLATSNQKLTELVAGNVARLNQHDRDHDRYDRMLFSDTPAAPGSFGAIREELLMPLGGQGG